jgi:hypothetical protein
MDNSKQDWVAVYAEHKTDIAKRVSTWVTKINSESGIFASMFTSSEVNSMASQAFEKAYNKWDCDSPFINFFSRVFNNHVKDAMRMERRRRLRVVTFSFLDDFIEIQDCTGCNDPADLCDIKDFIDSLSEVHRLFVDAVIEANKILLLNGNSATPKKIKGELRRWSEANGYSYREYYRIVSELRALLEERAK